MLDDPALAAADAGPLLSVGLLYLSVPVMALLPNDVLDPSVGVPVITAFLGLTGVSLLYQAAFILVRTEDAVEHEIRLPTAGFHLSLGDAMYARAAIGAVAGLFAVGVALFIRPF